MAIMHLFHLLFAQNMQLVRVTTERERFRNSDRKFNVVIYGINESPKGSTKHDRIESDLQSVCSVLSKLNNNIQQQSIKHMHRLEKFNPTADRPRPILVKFIRVDDATNIFANKGSLSHPLVNKPDLTAWERQRDSLLLKARWKLFQDGIPCSDIKIQDTRLYVKRKLFYHFSNSQISYSSGTSQVPASIAPLHSSTIAGDNATKSDSPVIHTNSNVVFMSPATIHPIAQNTTSISSHVQAHLPHFREQSPSPCSSPPPLMDHISTHVD